MSSFTDGIQVGPPDAEQLAYVNQCLRQELKRLARKTPPIPASAAARFHQPNYRQEQSSATLLHMRFTTKDLEARRKQLPYLDYWQREAEHFRDSLAGIMMDKIFEEGLRNGLHPADAWKETAFALQRKLKRQGLSSQQVNEVRLELDDEWYWHREAEHLNLEAEEREYKFHRRLADLPTWSSVDTEGLTIPYTRGGTQRRSLRRQVPPSQELRRSKRIKMASRPVGDTTPASPERPKSGRRKHKRSR